METIQKSKLLIYFCWIWELLTECYVYPNGVATCKLLASPKYFINTSKSAKKIRSVTCHYTPVAKYQSSSKSLGCRKKFRYMITDDEHG
jgi:hypothetical protein